MVFQVVIAITSIIVALLFGYVLLFYENETQIKQDINYQIELIIYSGQIDSAYSLYKSSENNTPYKDSLESDLNWKELLVTKNYMREIPEFNGGVFDILDNEHYIYVNNLDESVCKIFDNYVIAINDKSSDIKRLIQKNATAVFGCIDASYPSNTIQDFIFYYRLK
jgi:hypothetical protein